MKNKNFFAVISYFVLALLLCFNVSCNNDDDENIPDAPTVSVTGLSSDLSVDITNSMNVKMTVSTPGYLVSLVCQIESPTINEYLIETLRIPDTFDLVNPTSDVSQFLNSQGVLNGEENLYGKTLVTIDLSTALSNIPKIKDVTATHKFTFTAVDLYGQSLTFSFTANQFKSSSN